MIDNLFQFIENYATPITAISAVIGVFVAVITIFIPYIYKNINKPNLCVSTSGSNKALFTPILFTTLNKNGFSLKLDISNTGRSEATKVQLCLNKIFYQDSELSIAPLKLNWSYQDTDVRLCLPPKTHTSILQGSHAHCDFLFLLKNDKKEYEAFLASQVGQFNKLENTGHYKIKLALGAREIETSFWEISFDFSKKALDKNEIISNINCKKEVLYE